MHNSDATQPSVHSSGQHKAPPTVEAASAINSSSDVASTLQYPDVPLPYVLLELCCGSANLCKAFNDSSLTSVGVDHVYNKQVAQAPVVVASLADDTGQSLVSANIDKHRPQVIHAGPPCGTASRARERPIPKALALRGAPQPRPLRSEQYPLGLPNLTDYERQRSRLPMLSTITSFRPLSRDTRPKSYSP